jgi:microcystin degradation protein MlrC
MMNRLKIGVAGLVHETNTFAPGITEIEAFEKYSAAGKEAFYKGYEGTKTPAGGAIDFAKHHGVELIPAYYAEARPGGMVSASAIEQLLESVVESIPDQLDGLLLILHGAMVSETYMDVEEELLRRIRARFSDSLPIATVVDLHANISSELVRKVDILVGYKTYPHIDTYETALEAMKLLAARTRSEIAPHLHWQHTRMLVVPQSMITDAGAMGELMQRASEMELHPAVLNITVAGGFPYSDIPEAGMSFVVTTDGDPALAEALATELCTMAQERRDRFAVKQVSVEEAIQKSLESEEGPDIFIEGSDNIGGGGPGDATYTLKHLVHVKQKSLIVIRDMKAVDLAHDQGVGSRLECLIGGNTDAFHGTGVPVQGRVRLLFDGIYHHRGPYMTGRQVYMGRTAVVESGHVTIILTEIRSAPYDIGHVYAVGLDPKDFKIIVVKSAVAWRTAFGPIAKREFDLDTQGACSANLHHFQYKHLHRPIYPLDPV